MIQIACISHLQFIPKQSDIIQYYQFWYTVKGIFNNGQS